MKITDVRTHLIDQYMFVQVDTDEGISGVGESGAWAFFDKLRAWTRQRNTAYLLCRRGYKKAAALK